MKAYIVMRVDWDYNDEYYYKHEGDPGHAVKAYRSREIAESALKKMTTDLVRGGSGYPVRIFEYGDSYDVSESLERLQAEHPKLASALGLNAGKRDAHYGYTIPKTATDDEVIQFLTILDLMFFRVEEIELDLDIPTLVAQAVDEDDDHV